MEGKVSKTCKHGHALDSWNIYTHPKNGRKECKTCKALRGKRPSLRLIKKAKKRAEELWVPV
jgi:hypothetical protein